MFPILSTTLPIEGLNFEKNIKTQMVSDCIGSNHKYQFDGADVIKLDLSP